MYHKTRKCYKIFQKYLRFTFFLLEELAFALYLGAVAMAEVTAEAAISGHNAMARDIRSEGVPFERLAHCLRRSATDATCQLTVGDGLPCRNLKKFQVHLLLERGYFRRITDFFGQSYHLL